MLKTDRLIVRQSTFDNFENVYRLLSDAEVMRYVGRGVKTREETEEGLEKMIHHFEKHGFSFGDVYEKGSEIFVGRAGLIYLEMNDSQPEIELGYTLHKFFWNKGYATELAKGFIQRAFQDLFLEKLISVAHLENKGSAHVLEKAGMHYVGRISAYNTEVDKFEIFKNAAGDGHD